MQDVALSYLASGLSVIPTDPTSKRPYKGLQWEPYQKVLPTPEQVESWFQNGASIAVVGGVVSGNLEVIDFDEPGLRAQWFALLKSWNCEPLARKLLLEKSPRGGDHIVYRHQGKPEGNQKLAWDVDKKVRIETRGEGGYCLVHPSAGYTLKAGDYTKLPLITAEEREALLAACRTFDMAPPEYVSRGQGRVGDDFNERASISEILTPLGWQSMRGDKWVRPGKDPRDGWSATWNHKGNRHFVVFTSSAGIEPGAYDLFGLYARLHHGGDFKAATRAARNSGYGQDAQEVAKYKAGLPALAVLEERPAQRWTTGANIVVRKTEWLWEPYVPLGEVTLLAGDPGVGKSTLAQAIATCTTLGSEIMGKRFAEGNVIFLSAEQSVSRVTIPRFNDMEANLSRIILPDDEGEDGTIQPFVLDNDGIDELAEQAKLCEAKLIVIDTITAYIEGARDMNSANQTREWIRRLADIARMRQCGLMMLGHYNKNSQAKSIYRIVGSIDFVGASRSVLACGTDPDQKDVRAADHIKSNVGPLGPGIGFSIEDGRFTWTGPSDLTAERMFEAPVIREARSKREDCAKFILESMNGMPQFSVDMERKLKDAGFSERIWKDVKRQLKIASERDRFGDEGAWQWVPPTKEDTQRWWQDRD